MNEAIHESFEELTFWMPWASKRPTIEESEERCQESVEKFKTREDLQLLLFLKSTGEFVGSSGLLRPDWSVPRFEIGYWCRTAHTGQGLISEAVIRIVHFAFESLHAKRVEICCDSKNVKSYKVPERLGFQLEGILRNHRRDSCGELSDTRVYSIVSLDELRVV